MGELFEQDGGEVEVAVEADAVALEVGEDAEQREIGFGGGFEEPLHAVGPGAVVDDVRQMSVQGEGEKSCGLFRCLGHDVYYLVRGSCSAVLRDERLRDETSADSKST